MSKKEYIDYICRPFCTYFKEGQKEEMACRGALTVKTLIERCGIDPQEVALLPKTKGPFEKYRRLLDEIVCRDCDFREEDCDFQSDSPESENPEPCGGYIVLFLMLAHRLIDENMTEITR